MLRTDEKFEGRDLEIYVKGVANGVRFAEREFLDRIEEKEDDRKLDKDRLVGIINDKVEVQRLESDSDDFYAGYVAGVEAAYEVYLKKPAFNCHTGVFASCDRSIPCDRCDFNDGFKRELSEEYCQGYDAGYTKCSAAWGDLIPEGLRNADEERGECRYFDEEEIWNPKYIKGYKRGYNQGFEDGVDDGMGDILELDEDVLDAIYEIREQIKGIQGYARTVEEPDEITHRMVIELYTVQTKLTDLAQMLVMDNVFKYWHKRQIEEDR